MFLCLPLLANDRIAFPCTLVRCCMSCDMLGPVRCRFSETVNFSMVSSLFLYAMMTSNILDMGSSFWSEYNTDLRALTPE